MWPYTWVLGAYTLFITGTGPQYRWFVIICSCLGNCDSHSETSKKLFRKHFETIAKRSAISGTYFSKDHQLFCSPHYQAQMLMILNSLRLRSFCLSSMRRGSYKRRSWSNKGSCFLMEEKWSNFWMLSSGVSTWNLVLPLPSWNSNRKSIHPIFPSLTIASTGCSHTRHCLWTFSHFLPRAELNKSGAHHVMPPGVAGDSNLDLQIRQAKATGHVYGHSHVGQDMGFRVWRFFWTHCWYR